MSRSKEFDSVLIDEHEEEKNGEDRKFVAAIGRAFDILRAFRPGEGPMGNSELATATGLPKATVSRLTHTLPKLVYLNYFESAGRYEPSPSILALGYCVLSNMRVRQLARDYMQQLADHGKTMVALAARDRLSMIYVAMCNGSNIRTLHLDVGTRVNIATSATGRAFLAGISESEREYFFNHFKRIYGSDWPNLRKRILASIAEVEERGFCLVDGEWQRDVRAIGVPLVSPDGNTVMSMNCASPKFHLTREMLENDLGP